LSSASGSNALQILHLIAYSHRVLTEGPAPHVPFATSAPLGAGDRIAPLALDPHRRPPQTALAPANRGGAPTIADTTVVAADPRRRRRRHHGGRRP
jgi:hypothetical protein